MKHTFKKVAAIVLAVLMCVTAIVPAVAATETACPGAGKTHTAVNCSYIQASVQAATCDESGFVIGQCTTCATKFTVSQTDALGHDWDAVVASCTKDATKTCKVCKKVETVAKASGHSFGEWTLASGVCKAGERITRTCSVCGEVEKTTIPAEGHKFELVSYIEPATCLAYGTANYECKVAGCEATKTVSIKDTNPKHNYIKWNAAKALATPIVKGEDPNYVAPKCDANGRESLVCTYCAKVVVVTINKEAAGVFHTPFVDPTTSNGFVAVVPAKCTETGFASHTYCVDCRIYFPAGTTVFSDANAVEKEDLVLKSTHTATDSTSTITVTAEVLPTCTSAGYRYETCSVADCTYKNVKVDLPALGAHVYYPDVTDKAAQAEILKALAAAGKTVTTWAALGAFDAATPTGAGIAWDNYKAATCVTDASIDWLCLTCADGKLLADVQCGAVGKKTAVPAGDEYKAFGHDFDDPTPVENPAATCTTAGMSIYSCQNAGCHEISQKQVAAKGHSYVEQLDNPKTTEVENKPTTCKEAGIYYNVCSVCGDVQTVTKASTGAEHVWVEIDDVTNKKVLPTCTTAGSVVRYCSLCNEAPHTDVLDALGHKYVDVAKYDFSKVTATAPDTTNKVELAKAGNCEQGATYKITCQRCAMFMYHEIAEGYAQGHVKVYVNDTAVGATCTTAGHSNQWYCKNKACPFYLNAAGLTDVAIKTFVTGKTENWDTTVLATHVISDGKDGTKAVSYKDVPDEKVSSAATAAKAQEVVSSTGAKAVAIPGTTLVWVYAYEADNECLEKTITKGGLYCVACKQNVAFDDVTASNGVTAKAGTGAGHGTLAVTSQTANCLQIGYTMSTCPNCFMAVMTSYAPVANHNYDDDKNTTGVQIVLDANVLPTCDRAGYQIDTCVDCGLVTTVSVPALGHNTDINDAGVAVGVELTTSCLDTSINRKCDRCQQTIAKAHNFGTGTTCKECGATK